MVRPIGEVIQEFTERLMAIPGVQGVAESLCAGSPSITVYVVRSTPELLRRIPPTLEEYPVVIKETGALRAQRSNRPEPGAG
jgi:hypothetical protein